MSSLVRHFYNCQKQKVKNTLETLYTAIRYHRPCFMLCALTSKYKATKSKLVWVPFKHSCHRVCYNEFVVAEFVLILQFIKFSYLILKHSIRHINLLKTVLSLVNDTYSHVCIFKIKTTFFSQKMLSHWLFDRRRVPLLIGFMKNSIF